MKKLLLVGTDTIHVLNYFNMVGEFFDQIFVITNANGEKYKTPFKNINFSIKNPIKAANSIKQIKKVIDEFQPTIIHIHQAGTCAFLTLKAAENKQVPTIVTAWGSDILHTPNLGLMYKKMVKYILQKADFFTSDSLFMAAEMTKLAEKNLPILVANFGTNIIIDNSIEKENIVYSNRLHKKFYRIDKIIMSFDKFLKTRIDENWKLKIAGDGEDTERLKKIVDDLELYNSVEFVGWVDKKKNSEFYQKAKIFISIPENDATSISLLEALAADCIPILSNLPANSEWVINGLNGVIAVNLDEDFISEALKIDYENMKSINWFLTNTKSTIEVNKKKFINLYKSILNEES